MFPAIKPQTNIKHLAQEAVDEGIRGPFRGKQKSKKK
jgi:hypothetical protein